MWFFCFSWFLILLISFYAPLLFHFPYLLAEDHFLVPLRKKELPSAQPSAPALFSSFSSVVGITALSLLSPWVSWLGAEIGACYSLVGRMPSFHPSDLGAPLPEVGPEGGRRDWSRLLRRRQRPSLLIYSNVFSLLETFSMKPTTLLPRRAGPFRRCESLSRHLLFLFLLNQRNSVSLRVNIA